MFSQDQNVVDKLLVENEKFRVMYDRHEELNKQTDKANIGALGLCDDTLHDLKKEKLHLRDELAVILEECKQQSG